MKTERKIIVSENGKLVLKKILLSGKDENGKNFYIFDQDKKKERKESYYERVENNFLLIGLLKKIDMSGLNKEEINQLMYHKHEKEEKFLKTGERKGFNLGVDMDPDDILRFYISLTPEERMALNCKP
ncbi:hypothetical protein V7O62_03465 [Methanolobus sp. ZRKC2]|uniref:hypothetical protein n=1 Tax=Methanolobus sp. ZRKC2 TaxID=3125783 RepID=UPI00324A3ED8